MEPTGAPGPGVIAGIPTLISSTLTSGTFPRRITDQATRGEPNVEGCGSIR